ncbi:antitoxin Xre/MbcA/ParS toxin-binding domain-containing protein [Lysobacter humi (ex Lee et al. 2017)]
MGNTSDYQVLDGFASAQALTYGALRATKTLDLDRQLLQFILATDARLVDSLLGSQALLDPDSPEGRRALTLVRLHRALGDVYGSAERVHAFLDTHSPALGATPRSLFGTECGVQRVLDVVEADVRDSLEPPQSARDARGPLLVDGVAFPLGRLRV